MWLPGSANVTYRGAVSRYQGEGLTGLLAALAWYHDEDAEGAKIGLKKECQGWIRFAHNGTGNCAGVTSSVITI